MSRRKVWLAVGAFVAIAAFLVVLERMDRSGTTEVSASRIAAEIRAGRVTELGVSPERMQATLAAGDVLVAAKEGDATLDETLSLLGIPSGGLDGIDVAFAGQSTVDRARGVGITLLVIVAVAAAAWMVTSGRGLATTRFGRSGARLHDPNTQTVTFADVAGAEEAKEELAEFKAFLRRPERFRRVGARTPTGVLLVGPPGTGKTLLARAVAGEADVPFFSISGSQFVEVYVGVGASRVRDLFRQAKRASPSIIFIDEIDAVGRSRGRALSHDEREQTLNQLLVEMDGFDSDANVVVMAATNRVDVLDAALLRPGRFDRRITVDRPDVIAREAILDLHARGKPLGADVKLAELARSTVGFSGADLANLVNEAAIFAARRDKAEIGMSDFQEALVRIIAGPRRKSRVMSDRERRVVAYHEAGHAVVMHNVPDSDPVHRVSIVARGQAGGYTMSVPEQESSLYAREKLTAKLTGLLGGRAAEEIVFGRITTGASNDMERATHIARSMVTRFGMSEKLGPMVYGDAASDDLELGGRRDYSESVAEEIDQEVRRMVSEAHALAKDVLRRHRATLNHVAERLIEQETIDADTFAAICASVPAPPPKSRMRWLRAWRRPGPRLPRRSDLGLRGLRPPLPRLGWSVSQVRRVRAAYPRASEMARLAAVAAGAVAALASLLRRGTAQGL